ncbi:MAG: VWA domain-containing protein [Planctomycetes bacterium]|nr:VWA domain-containing protein [Planctomycetota bacterium]
MPNLSPAPSPTPTPEPGGLFSAQGRVPLRGIAVEVRARGVAASVAVAQRYRNDEKVPVEAVYTFPLPEGCAACGFEVEIGGKRIVGRVEEREKAFEEYDAAMAEGHGAFLMDQDRPDIFTANVGNLLPGQEAVVRLRYVTELEQTRDLVRLVIPTTVSPRYVPRAMAKEADPAELDHIAPPAVLGGVPYGLALTVDLEATSEVREVSCPSHPARVALDGRSVRVELLGDDVQLDRDFVLEVALARPHEASAVVARETGGARAVMVSLYPDLSGFRRGPCELVFVLDRSGSMQGSSIDQARRALQLCLRSMEEGDRFNIVGFGSAFEAMFPEPVAYSQASLEEATKKVDAVGADLGGTEILAPLRFALESGGSRAIPRVVVLLTDGQVGNEAECIDLAAAHASSARVFTFGIGRGPSRHLVRGIARASGGQAELIHPGERIEPKVLRQFGRMAAAHLKDVRLNWGALETDLVAPAQLPPLFDGDRLTVYGRVTGGQPCEVAVEAEGPGGKLRFPVFVDLEKAADDAAVPALLGRKAIEDLEEGRGLGVRGSAQRGRREGHLKARIVELARRYGLMSSDTSFVAVEERPEGASHEAAALRRIPVALTKGWGGLEDTGSAILCQMAYAGPAFSEVHSNVLSAAPLDEIRAAPLSTGGRLGRLARSLGKAFVARREEAPPSRPPSTKDDLELLARAQRADGAFELTEDLARIAGGGRENLERLAAQLQAHRRVAEAVVATLAALGALERAFSGRRDEWRLLAEKARRWLAGTKVAPPAGFPSLEAWMGAAMAT